MARARVALASGLVVVLGCSTPGQTDDLPDRAGPGDRTTASSDTTLSVAEETLPVVDSGVTIFTDPLDEAQNLGGYGVVVRNPDDERMATGVSVTTTFIEEAGETVLHDTARLNAVMPGDTMAVGRTLLEPLEGPLTTEVEVTVAAWLEPATSEGGFEVVETETAPEPGGGSVTTFTVRSTWPRDETGIDVTAVYRDAEGSLLAAESALIEELAAGGEVEGTIQLLAPIPGVASTEVLVGRGFRAQTDG